MLNSAAIKRLVTVMGEIRQSADVLPILKILYARIAITIYEDAVDIMRHREGDRVSIDDVIDAMTDLSEDIAARDAVFVRCSSNAPAFPLCVHVSPPAFKRLMHARGSLYHTFPQSAARAMELIHFSTEQLFVKFIDQLAKRFARHRNAKTLMKVDVTTAIEAFTNFRLIRNIPAVIANALSPPTPISSRSRSKSPRPSANQNPNPNPVRDSVPVPDLGIDNDPNPGPDLGPEPSPNPGFDTHRQGRQEEQATPLQMPLIPQRSSPTIPAAPSRPRRTRRPPIWLADYETRLDLRTLPRNLRVQHVPHDRNNLVTAVVRAFNSQTGATGSERLTAAICHGIFEDEDLDAREDNTREQLNLLARRLKVSIGVHDAEYESVILYGRTRRRIFIRRSSHYDAYVL